MDILWEDELRKEASCDSESDSDDSEDTIYTDRHGDLPFDELQKLFDSDSDASEFEGFDGYWSVCINECVFPPVCVICVFNCVTCLNVL